jgi:hypothetical protein
MRSARTPGAIARYRASSRWLLRSWLCFTLGGMAAGARADLTDEIQVYADGINAPGQFHLELHLNTTPDGRSRPDHASEVTPARGERT